MAYILSLETATKTCSVAIAQNEKLIGVKEITTDKFSHAEKLNLYIEELLQLHDLEMSQLDAVAVSAGPGSYTGLRIGTSTAKGICYAMDLPLISINSLQSLAALCLSFNGLVCPMFDARRMEVYAAVFNLDLKTIISTDAIVIDEFSFKELLDDQSVTFIGPGARKCADVIMHPNALFDLDVEVSASGMVGLAYEKYESHDFEDLAYFEPAYLKDFCRETKKVL